MKLYLAKILFYFHYIYYRNTLKRYYYFLINSVFCILLSLTCIHLVMLILHSWSPLLANSNWVTLLPTVKGYSPHPFSYPLTVSVDFRFAVAILVIDKCKA